MIRKLHDQVGIEAAGATSACRTFGASGMRHHTGYHVRHIREVLGRATLFAAKAPCDGEPAGLGRIQSALALDMMVYMNTYSRTNDERLRDLVEASGLTQPVALTVFRRGRGLVAYSGSTWKA